MNYITSFFFPSSSSPSSSQPPPTFSLPPPIPIPDLVSPSRSPDTSQQLRDQLKTHRFALLRPCSEGKATVLGARGKAKEFFDLPFQEKKKSQLPPIKGEIYDKVRNRGYMPHSSQEYYKMRVIDTPENYPENPEGIANAYIQGIEYMHSVVRAALNCVAEGEKVEKKEGEKEEGEGSGKGKEEGEEEGEKKGDKEKEKEENEEGRWIMKDTMKAMEPFLLEGSSISTLRYFDETKPRWQEIGGKEEEDEKEKGEETQYQREKQKIDEINVDLDKEHIALGAHYDTGVFTLILIGETPGLQVWCEITKQWLEMEKIGQLHDLVLIMGRKIEILTEKNVPLEPTYHRVCIDRSVRRHSILFFYDLLTSNDD